ncbi:MAG: hypothetical protein V8R80_06670 [Eubacterium sp.]
MTGHYERIEYDQESGRYLLKKAADDTKDQSYVLYAMTQEQLAHTIFPLGELRRGSPESQRKTVSRMQKKRDGPGYICFVTNNSYADFIKNFTGKDGTAKEISVISGNVLGRHRGIISYTISKRRKNWVFHFRNLCM